jgi:hypothetical protein
MMSLTCSKLLHLFRKIVVLVLFKVKLFFMFNQQFVEIDTI